MLPARYDALPDAAMEALACGLPVVTSTKKRRGGARHRERRRLRVRIARRGGAHPPHAGAAGGGRSREAGENARNAVLPLARLDDAQTGADLQELLEFSIAHKLAERPPRRDPDRARRGPALHGEGRPRVGDASASGRRRSGAPCVAAGTLMARMRLAIVRQKYTPFGGAERFVERALAALAERDVEITLVAPGGGSERRRAHQAAHRQSCRTSVARCATRVAASCAALAKPRWARSSSRIERIRAATSTVRATACTPPWIEEARARRPPERMAIAASPHHRYMTIGAERRCLRARD